MCIRDSLYTVNRLNGWQKGQVSGMELEVNEYSRLEPAKEEIRARVDTQVDAYGGTYYTQTVEEVNPCLLYTSIGRHTHHS